MTSDESSSSKQPYKYNGKELDRMHGLDTYDYGARQYDPILARWDRIDQLCEKYYNVSPYAYCVNNPVNAIDPDGKDGVRIIDDENKIIIVKADYYVRTGETQYCDSKGKIKTLSGYSSKDIENMNKYNDYLNNLDLTVSFGDYEGYKIQFDLTFQDGGTTEQLQAMSDEYEGFNIGNSIAKGTSQAYRSLSRLKRIEHPDGTTSVVGGVTDNNKRLFWN